MSLSPEVQLLVINAAILLVAYFGIYPSLRPLTLGRFVRADLVISGLALGLAWALFGGTGTRFWLLFGSVNWFWFSLLSFMALELPLFSWFSRRHGIDWLDPDA